jgi:hypothetical protein
MKITVNYNGMQATVPTKATEARNSSVIAISLVLLLTTVFLAGGVWFTQFGR